MGLQPLRPGSSQPPLVITFLVLLVSSAKAANITAFASSRFVGYLANTPVFYTALGVNSTLTTDFHGNFSATYDGSIGNTTAVVYAGAVDAFTNLVTPVNLFFNNYGQNGGSSSMGMISLVATRKLASGQYSMETACRAVFLQVVGSAWPVPFGLSTMDPLQMMGQPNSAIGTIGAVMYGAESLIASYAWVATYFITNMFTTAYNSSVPCANATYVFNQVLDRAITNTSSFNATNTTANYAMLAYLTNTTCAINGSTTTPYTTDALYSVSRILSGVGSRFGTLITSIYSSYSNVSAFATPNLPSNGSSMAIANTATKTGHNGDDQSYGFTSIGSIGNFSTCNVQPVRWAAHFAKLTVIVFNNVTAGIAANLDASGNTMFSSKWKYNSTLFQLGPIYRTLYETTDSSNTNRTAILNAFGLNYTAPQSLTVTVRMVGALVNCSGYWTNIYEGTRVNVTTNANGSFTIPYASYAHLSMQLNTANCTDSFTSAAVPLGSVYWSVPQIVSGTITLDLLGMLSTRALERRSCNTGAPIASRRDMYYMYRCFGIADSTYNSSDFVTKNYTSFSPSSIVDSALNSQILNAVASVAALYAPTLNKSVTDVADMALRKIVDFCETSGFNSSNITSLSTQFANVFSENTKGNLKVQGQASDIANAMDSLPSMPDVTNITTLATDGSAFIYTTSSSSGSTVASSSVGRKLMSLFSSANDGSVVGRDGLVWKHDDAGAPWASESAVLPVSRRRLFQSTADTATVVTAITTVTASLNTLLSTLQASATTALSANSYLDWRSYTTQIAQVSALMSGQFLTDITSLGSLLANGSSITTATSTLLSTYSGTSLTTLLAAQAISTTAIYTGSPASATTSSSSSIAMAVGLGVGLGLGVPLIAGGIGAYIWYRRKKMKSPKVADTVTLRAATPPKAV